MSGTLHADVAIAGAGVIGLSIGLELRERGLSVIVLERHQAMRAASWAAGGMLAARDPENPAALLPLSLRSLELYPEFLKKVQVYSGVSVPLRSRRTLQQVSSHTSVEGAVEYAQLEEIRQWIPGFAARDWKERFVWLEEESIDPRDMCRALPRAFAASKGTLLEGVAVLSLQASGAGVAVETSRARIEAGVFINCCGAWAGEPRLGGLPVEPVKGQAVTVALAPERLRCVLRTPEFYSIPRGDGRVTVGATVEHVGFDETVEEPRVAELLRTAARLLPEIADAERLESWTGLRPGTPDGLPIMGKAALEHCWHATGHYRNGVLLAPVTARVMAQAITSERTDVALDAFSPDRFDAATASTASRLSQAVETAPGQRGAAFGDRDRPHTL